MNDIRAIREHTLQFTQAELAEKLGVKQATISRWEAENMHINDRRLLAVEALAARMKHKGARKKYPQSDRAKAVNA